VASWIAVLQDDPREIFRAAVDAETINRYVLAFEQIQTVRAKNDDVDSDYIIQLAPTRDDEERS
jgi:antirestriction protein ArdC